MTSNDAEKILSKFLTILLKIIMIQQNSKICSRYTYHNRLSVKNSGIIKFMIYVQMGAPIYWILGKDKIKVFESIYSL